jgi:hypothetical protein
MESVGRKIKKPDVSRDEFLCFPAVDDSERVLVVRPELEVDLESMFKNFFSPSPRLREIKLERLTQESFKNTLIFAAKTGLTK